MWGHFKRPFTYRTSAVALHGITSGTLVVLKMINCTKIIGSDIIPRWDFSVEGVTRHNVAFELNPTRRLSFLHLKPSKPQSENKNENKVPVEKAQTYRYLISGRTRRTSSVSPPREPQPPTPAPVRPHHLDSGSPGNIINKETINLYLTGGKSL